MLPKAIFTLYVNQEECLVAFDYQIIIAITVNDYK